MKNINLYSYILVFLNEYIMKVISR